MHSRGDEDEPLASWGRSRKQRCFGVKDGAELLKFPHTRVQENSVPPSSAGKRMHILLVYWLGIFFSSLSAGKLQLFSL